MSKYKNVKTHGFDSKKEYGRYAELQVLEKSGVISSLETQVEFGLIPPQEGERAVKYRADFVYVQDGKKIVEDVKSSFTKSLPAWIIKRKLMLWIHGIRVTEV
jgi:Protein of unknown function (DUF1064)